MRTTVKRYNEGCFRLLESQKSKSPRAIVLLRHGRLCRLSLYGISTAADRR